MEEILYNVKLAAVMKNQILRDVSDIFEYSTKAEYKEELSDSVASCILALMLLSRRCGIGLEEIQKDLLSRINTGIADRSICETRFHDLSNIAQFIRRE